MSKPYASEQPGQPELAAMSGPVVVDFGTNWCSVCNAAAPAIGAALAKHPDVPHIKVEDGSGLALGRSFKIKLWPTLVFMRDGQEIARLVRPTDAEAVEQALNQVQSRD